MTGGEFRSYSTSGLDGNHQVKVEMNSVLVLSVIIASPYSGAKVKEALRAGYNKVRQYMFSLVVCHLSKTMKL